MSGQGRFLARRATARSKRFAIADHLLTRFRERWPDSRHLSNNEVRNFVIEQIERAKRDHTMMPVPHHPYTERAPIMFMGVPGWAVIISDGTVITVYVNEEEEK